MLHSMSCLHFYRSASRKAFTLVELLVVLELIVLLISILLPAITKVRASSISAHCAANLREISQAAMIHCSDHDGYLPLSGRVAVPASSQDPGQLAPALNDAAARRYVYAPRLSIPAAAHVVSFNVAIARTLGARTFDVSNIQASLQSHSTGALKMLLCPATNGELNQGVSTIRFDFETTGGIALVVYNHSFMDYAPNGFALGFNWRREGKQPAAKLSLIKSPSSTVLLADANANASFLAFASDGSTRGRDYTLADFLVRTDAAILGATMDLSRHRGRANVVFMDGHVETLTLTRKALAAARLGST